MGDNRGFRNNLLGFSFLILFFFATWISGKFFALDLDSYRQFLLRFPLAYSAAVFVIVYVLVSFFLWFTKDIFKVIGGLLFGAYLSTFLVWTSEMINATILFNMARVLGRDFVRNTLKGAGESLDKRIQRYGFWGVFSLRIIPLVPFRFLDIFAGLTNLRFRDYLLAAALGSPLRIFWLQYILSAVGEGVFRDPQVLTRYLLQNPLFFLLSFGYFIGVIVLAVILKRLIKTNG